MSKYSAEKVVQDIINYIEEKFENKKQIIVAIDGRCAAGKTTLTSLLQKKTGANIFHMDDFFLRPEQRTPERFSQPGGNVDYERFYNEVVLPIHNKQSFTYRIFGEIIIEIKLSLPVMLSILIPLIGNNILEFIIRWKIIFI